MARREASLHEVAAKAKDIGSPDVLVVAGDVSNPEDCQKFVQTTVERFGQCKMELQAPFMLIVIQSSDISCFALYSILILVDHLVNNAGVANVSWFEEISDVADFKQVMVGLSPVLWISRRENENQFESSAYLICFLLQAVNFWGAVHPTHCALPHLKKSGGKIFVNSSAAAVLAMPRMSFYNVHLSFSIACFLVCDRECGIHVSNLLICNIGENVAAGQQGCHPKLLRDPADRAPQPGRHHDRHSRVDRVGDDQGQAPF